MTSNRKVVFGTPFSDAIVGSTRDQIVLAGWGDDMVDPGGGQDIVRLGRGDDVAQFVLADNDGHRGHDLYNGGRGSDTLRLVFTSEEWSSTALRSDVERFLAFLNGQEDAGPSRSFRFEEIALTVRRFEDLEVEVDGRMATLVLSDPGGTTTIDRSASTEDEFIEVLGNGNATVTTGSGHDTIETGGGNDLVAIGDGDDVVRTGDGDDTVVAGAGGGDDFIDTGGGDGDLVRYPSAMAPVWVDLNPLDRSGDPAVVAVLAGPGVGLAPGTPVGIATGADIGTDVLLGIENAEGGAGDDTLVGNTFANTLTGKGGDDLIDGGPTGGLGEDTAVFTGPRADYDISPNFDGSYTVADTGGNGDGTDIIANIEALRFADGDVELWTLFGGLDIGGSDGPDAIFGSPGDDFITPNEGDDAVFALAGTDRLAGGAGDDTLDGGSGTEDDDNRVLDTVDYFNDALIAGAAAGPITVDLGAGTATDPFGDSDTLIDIEAVIGTNLADSLTGSDKFERFAPMGGNDTVAAGGEFDALDYSGALDAGGSQGVNVTFSVVTEGAGTAVDPFGDTDTFSGIERLVGTDLDDTIVGGAGRQLVRAFDGADTFDGGDGFDRMDYRGQPATQGILADLSVVGEDGFAEIVDGLGNVDRVRNVEDIRGTFFLADLIVGDAVDNRLVGVGGNDTLVGNGGNDWIEGEDGDDSILGGSGEDFISGGSGGDFISGGSEFDDLNGEGGNDLLLGDGGSDFILGGSGDDMLEGGDGDDYLQGDAGSNTYIGGAGSDNFVIGLLTVDGPEFSVITDYTTGEDFVSVFADSLESTGDPRTFDFIFNTTGIADNFPDDIPTFVQNTNTFELFFDGDGSGSELDSTLVANLNALIDPNDFFVV